MNDRLVDDSKIFPLNARLTVQMQVPMKIALVKTAAARGFSASDLLRDAVNSYIATQYPQYRLFYERAVQEQLTIMRNLAKGELGKDE